MNNDKHKTYIIESFDEWYERKHSEPIDEYNQTERFDKLAKANPQKFGRLNSQFKKVASMQRQNKTIPPRYITKDGRNKPAIDIKRLSGDPYLRRRDETPITTNRNLSSYEKQQRKQPRLFDNVNYDETYDYTAITLGIGILDSIINKNDDYKDYDYIYEYIDKDTIDECLNATYEYLNEWKLNYSDINYCIEKLNEWLDEQIDIENGIVNECKKVKQFIRNKPIRW